MNIKRYLAASLVLFLFIFLYEFLIHGVLLKGMYEQTASVWRDYDQMMAYMPFNILIMVLLALWLSFAFAHLFEKGGWKNGLHFGLYFGIFWGILALGAYYYLPISMLLAVYWFIAYVIESLIGGLLLGLIYHKK